MAINDQKSPVSAPWGTHKFANPQTYAPKFHQPQQLRHIDQNSTLELGWEGVKPREKPKSVVEEMKETLDKINGLLNDLGSRGKTSSNKPQEVTRTVGITEKPMRDSTINSCLESLCDDISAVTEQLKDLSPKHIHREKTDQEVISHKSQGNETIEPSIGRLNSRKSSVSTINSQISSLVNSLEDHPKESMPLTPSDMSEISPTPVTGKRSRSSSGMESPARSTTFHRGSDLSQQVSMHRSNFSSIADLCGYGEVVPPRRQYMAQQLVKSKSSFIFSSEPNKVEYKDRAVHFTEYPPQRGSEKFDGIFHDDLTALLDDTARGLLVL
ncbi:hypothetical protein ACHWQZ_G007814 [Mnemiopsis leidyi]